MSEPSSGQSEVPVAGESEAPRQVIDGALREAIEEAIDGSTIEIGPGHYEGAITLRRPVRLVAIGAAPVVITAIGGPVITIEASGCELEGLTIEATGGAGVLVLARETHLERCTISSSREVIVDAISCALHVRGDDARVTVTACDLVGEGSGLVVEDGASAAFEGGSILSTKPSRVRSGARWAALSTQLGSSGRGRIVSVERDGAIELDGCQIAGGVSSSIFAISGAEVTVRRCSFSGGTGASLRVDSGARARVDASSFTTEARRAIVVRAGANVALDGCSLQGCGVRASQGAKISISGGSISGSTGSAISIIEGATLSAVDMRIVDGMGAAIVIDSSTAKLDRCEIRGTTGVQIDGVAKLAMTSSRIENASGPAVYVGARSIATVIKSRFRSCESGVVVQGGKLELAGGVIEGCESALVLSGEASSGVVAGVEISGSTQSTVELLAGAKLELNASVLRDGLGGIGVEGRSLLKMTGSQVLRIEAIGIAVIDGARAELSRCGIHHIARDALLVSRGQLLCVDCRITSGGEDGVVCQLEGQAQLENTLIEGHARHAVWTQGRGVVELTSCTLAHARAGEIGGESPSIRPPPSSKAPKSESPRESAASDSSPQPSKPNKTTRPSKRSTSAKSPRR